MGGAQGVGGEAREKEAIGRTRRRWEDDIKMDLQEVGVVCGDLTGFAQDRDSCRALVSSVNYLRFHKIAVSFYSSCKGWLASEEGFCCVE
jgi:hypothetical protein